jgi:hypothetical protein
MFKYFSLLLFFLTSGLFSQTLLRFTLDDSIGERRGPVAIRNLLLPDNVSTDSTSLHFYATRNGKTAEMVCQYDDGTLWFYADGPGRTFTLKREKRDPFPALMHVRNENGSYVLYDKERPILAYRYADTPAPTGADSVYHRSGYIHPLYTPSGMVLTRIQPPDHLHHYGIWGPWTKTHINGREVDFWNLGKGQGRVRFAGLLSVVEGDLFCSITVRQEHVWYDNGKEHTAIAEELTIRAWRIPGSKGWLVDYITTQSTPLTQGMELDQYRYGGGLGYRATEKWDRNNSTVLTSTGKTRKDADATRARWCRIEGASPAGTSGILFMDHPANREYPEPMRVWPPNSNGGRGDLFFEFCPIRLHGWHLAYGERHTLRYRMYVYDGNLSPGEAEAYWKGFTTFVKPNILIP